MANCTGQAPIYKDVAQTHATVAAGIVEPVRSGVEAGVRLGLGKQEQENFYMDADNVYRKKLEVDLQAEEDQDRRDKREV